MEYVCNDCKSVFDIKEPQNLLVRFLFTTCPHCNSPKIELTEKCKLLLKRKAKIIKIDGLPEKPY